MRDLKMMGAFVALSFLGSLNAFAGPMAFPSDPWRTQKAQGETERPVEADPPERSVNHAWTSQPDGNGGSTWTQQNDTRNRVEVSRPDAGGNYVVQRFGSQSGFTTCHLDPVTGETLCN